MCEAFQDMTLEEVQSKLCVYDPRHPDSEIMISDMRKPEGQCFCDNCHTGRDRLANQIMKMFDIVMSSMPKH